MRKRDCCDVRGQDLARELTAKRTGRDTAPAGSCGPRTALPARHRRRRVLLIAGVLQLAALAAASAPIETPLPPPDLVSTPPGSRYGGSVALDGDTALVGAFLANGGPGAGAGGGRADFFELQAGSWNPVFAFDGVQGGSPSHAGWDVAIDGDIAIVGAPGHDQVGIIGRAVVFQRTGGIWSQAQQLLASAPVGDEFFGNAVALDGTRLLIGDIGDDGNRGAAYVFERSGGVWSAVQKLVASSGAALDNFGFSLAIDGNRLVIGAPDSDPLGNKSGSAYVFRRSGGVWNQEAQLTASNGGNGDRFGTGVDIFEDTILVGAKGADAAYVFTRLGGVWTETAILKPPGPSGDFGASVALADQDGVLAAALVGAPTEGGSGVAHVFELGFTGWQHAQTILPSVPLPGGRFGSAVDVDGDADRAIVGAPFADEAFVYDALDLFLEVTIDIVPRSPDNVIGGRGGILVAILSEPGFQPTQDVDKQSLRFGKIGTEQSGHRCGRRFGRGDFNADGVDDLLCSFKFRKTALAVGDTKGILRGRLKTGRRIGGDDTLVVVAR